MAKTSIDFIAETYPFKYPVKTSWLYNSESYVAQYKVSGLKRLSLIVQDEVAIFTNVYVSDGHAVNARYSGFGGIEILPAGNKHLEYYLLSLSFWCRSNGVKELTLKLPPNIYDEHTGILCRLLEKNRFKLSVRDTNQYMSITDAPFRDRLKKNEKKKLRQCEEAGFQFRPLKANELMQAYNVISDNRSERGFPMTMTYEALKKMFDRFPEHYLLFGVFDHADLIATAVSIRVTERIMYNFYHGDRQSYRRFSPVVMIIAGTYAFCQSQGMHYLDLGISSVKGELNTGLFTFKQNCGCDEEDKRTYVKLF